MSLLYTAFWILTACVGCMWLVRYCAEGFGPHTFHSGSSVGTEANSQSSAAKMEEVFVAVMGVTGSGKSSFIRQATGDSRCRVGKTLTSETLDVQEYRCQFKGRTYVLIDTPGFDDSYKSNDEIVESILAWLEKSYRARKLLSGIIYLHRISDDRMQGSSLDNLRMFRKLCGFEALKNVLLVTTFWDKVSDAEGRQREQELSSNKEFWGRMIQKGSKMKRWSRDSHERVTKGILSAVVPEAKCALQAQIEIVDQGKRRNETDVVRVTLEAMRIEMNARLEQERSQMKERLEREQRQARHRHEREKARLRKEAARERQIEQDARIAATWEEMQRVELENFEANQQIQRQLQQMQEESRQAVKRLQEEEAREQAQAQYYQNFRCYHSGAEEFDRCSSCGVKLHKKRTHYYHCCHCSNDAYQYIHNQCSTCGVFCRISEHPSLVKKMTVDYHSCILM